MLNGHPTDIGASVMANVITFFPFIDAKKAMSASNMLLTMESKKRTNAEMSSGQ